MKGAMGGLAGLLFAIGLHHAGMPGWRTRPGAIRGVVRVAGLYAVCWIGR